MLACLSSHLAPSKAASAWERAAQPGLIPATWAGEMRRQPASWSPVGVINLSQESGAGISEPQEGGTISGKTPRGGSDHRESARQRLDDDGGAGVKVFWMEQDVMAAIKIGRFILGK